MASKVLWWTKSAQWQAPTDLVPGATSFGANELYSDHSITDASHTQNGSSNHPSSDASSSEREKPLRTWRDNWYAARTTNSGRIRVPQDGQSVETLSQAGGASEGSGCTDVVRT